MYYIFKLGTPLKARL